MAERAIRKERNVWMGSDTESAKQMLLRARNTHVGVIPSSMFVRKYFRSKNGTFQL